MSNPVLITGASQRVGLAVATDLLNKGYSVIITYRTHKTAVDTLRDAGAITIQADFSTDQGVKRCIESIKSHTQALRGIIHNASLWDSEKHTNNYSALFDSMMQIHAKAPYLLNMGLKDLLTRDGTLADIIHITDFVQDSGSDKHIAYAASKAALHNLTLSFAKLLAPTVKVNTLAPALLMFNDNDDASYKDKALNKSLMACEPGAIAAVEAVNYLLNSTYVTGETLQVNGGRHLKFS
ncbi:dihydromonapterin reductase [Alteromonas sp. 14N.309.X.WAT.G.H12]|uniref:dihydromonapterin reductase n=1 Tax=Alteromonas sp. 14N.309.X.WAT.G.H12 TaxID=3120824 RepID=UPI002FD26F35